LKKDFSSADDIGGCGLLQALKIQASSVSDVLDRIQSSLIAGFDDITLRRKMFIVPVSKIHPSVKGLFDLGLPAAALKVCTIILGTLA
jgi:hypothetical protein